MFRRGSTVISICGLVCFSSLSEDSKVWLSYEFPLFRLGDFFIGCCLGKVFLEGKRKCVRLSSTALEAVGMSFVAVCLAIYTLKKGFLGTNPVRYSILLLPSAVSTVYLFAKKEGRITSFFSHKSFIWLAKFSAYGFLIHQEIIYQAKYILFGPGVWESVLHKVVVLVVTFVITICLAVLYGKLVDRIWRRTLGKG